MREGNDRAIAEFLIYVGPNNAIKTTGDICDPLKRDVITKADILGTLFTLAHGEEAAARSKGHEITF